MPLAYDHATLLVRIVYELAACPLREGGGGSQVATPEPTTEPTWADADALDRAAADRFLGGGGGGGGGPGGLRCTLLRSGRSSELEELVDVASALSGQ